MNVEASYIEINKKSLQKPIESAITWRWQQ